MRTEASVGEVRKRPKSQNAAHWLGFNPPSSKQEEPHHVLMAELERRLKYSRVALCT